jgi:tetratricopeptide (TPR) repeat protein
MTRSGGRSNSTFRYLASLMVEAAWRIRSWISAGSGEAQKIECLRRWLRRRPYWWRGHLRLAQASLALGDITSAHAGALAIAQLEQGQPAKVYSEWLLGRCFLAIGDLNLAREKLESANQQPLAPVLRYGLREDLAAAYFALGDYQHCAAMLEQVPESQRSLQAESALRVCRNKAESRS